MIFQKLVEFLYWVDFLLGMFLFSKKRRFHSVAVAAVLLAGVIACAQDEDEGGALNPHRSSLSSQDAAALRAPLLMKLPFPAGMSFEVYQGNSGRFSHKGLNQYAWDFGLPEGTPVCAVAEGRVVRVKQDSADGGVDATQYGNANTIVLDHGAGRFTQYLHLQKDSALVKEGDLVKGGQEIARSGNTGFSSTPHLHFQVQDATGQSVPARFADVPGGNPEQGSLCTSANDGTGTGRYQGESLLPLTAFAFNEIMLNSATLPAHLLRLNHTYTVEGTVKSRSRKIVLYLMNPDGGKAVYTHFADVDSDGRFRLEFKMNKVRNGSGWSEAPTQSNMFALAIAPVEEDGSYWSSFSVPVTVR